MLFILKCHNIQSCYAQASLSSRVRQLWQLSWPTTEWWQSNDGTSQVDMQPDSNFFFFFFGVAMDYNYGDGDI